MRHSLVTIRVICISFGFCVVSCVPMLVPGDTGSEDGPTSVVNEYGYPVDPTMVESYPVWTDSSAINTALAPSATPDFPLTLTAYPTSLPPQTMSPEELATRVQFQENQGAITMFDNGGELTVALGNRFIVYLDDAHPVRDMVCDPQWLMGFISSGSGGPGLYPVYFEATILGTCQLVNGDFSITINVLEPTPEPTQNP